VTLVRIGGGAVSVGV
jgi:hypothetical protein